MDAAPRAVAVKGGSAMKRIVLLMVGILSALVVAAPMVYAQSDNGGAPEDASGTIVVNPGDYPGSCEFPFSLDFSGKAKTIELPNGGFIFTSPGLDVTITNLDTPENQATFNITGSFHQTTNLET